MSVICSFFVYFCNICVFLFYRTEKFEQLERRVRGDDDKRHLLNAKACKIVTKGNKFKKKHIQASVQFLTYLSKQLDADLEAFQMEKHAFNKFL